MVCVVNCLGSFGLATGCSSTQALGEPEANQGWMLLRSIKHIIHLYNLYIVLIISCKHGYSHLYLQLQQVVWRPLKAAKQLEWILSSRLSSDVLRKSV